MNIKAILFVLLAAGMVATSPRADTPPPAVVKAFDFGPPGQTLMPGWTPVNHETRYSPALGHGWGPRGGSPWAGAARTTSFGGPLLQDFCEAGGFQFRVKVPPARYTVTVYFDNSGFEGDDLPTHWRRQILINGKAVWSEFRPDGPAHALFRFEDTEPVGRDIWDTYMAPELARAAIFESTAGNNGIDLEFEADRVWGCKVQALIVHPVDDAESINWVAGQMKEVADAFRRQSICLDPPAPAFEPEPAATALGLTAWPVEIDDDVTPHATPPANAPRLADLRLRRVAVRGEFESFCLAIRPLRDLGECRFLIEPLRSASGTVAATFAAVQYGMRRSPAGPGYRTIGHTLRPSPVVRLPANITREIIVTAAIAIQAEAGLYKGTLAILDATGRHTLRVPLELEVRPVTLGRETEFLQGFHDVMPPELLPDAQRKMALEQTLILVKNNGMNAVSGGPGWNVTGWQDGAPLIAFGAADHFFAQLARHGFSRALLACDDMRFRGLHDDYGQGATAQLVERLSGMVYEEAFMAAWQAVAEHGREAGWPTIFYAVSEESKGADTAGYDPDFVRLMARASRRHPETLRTWGDLKESFATPSSAPATPAGQQPPVFETLDIRALKVYDQADLDDARRLNQTLHVVNQGRTRYSAGLHLWAAFNRGIRGHWHWSRTTPHGYQFFDLDGRESDSAMICYGRNTLYTTLDFERCREGAEDFYLFQQLAREAERHAAREPGASAAAHAFLSDRIAGVGFHHAKPPDGFDADALKRRAIELLEPLTADP